MFPPRAVQTPATRRSRTVPALAALVAVLAVLAVALAAVTGVARPAEAAVTAVDGGQAGAVEGESLSWTAGRAAVVPEADASGDRGLLLYASGTARGTLRTTARATRLEVRWRADLCDGAPTGDLVVDGRTVASASVASSTWRTTTATGDWAAGEHAVAVTYRGDHRTSSCDRNLRVDVVRALAAPATAPADGSAVGPGTWVTRQVVGDRAVTDSRGRRWDPATGDTGGSVLDAWGGIAGSASPQLWGRSRVGVARWAVDVPVGAVYSIDLLMADSYDPGPGRRVFDVSAADGPGAPVLLQSGVDVAKVAGGWWSYHVTGAVPVTSSRLVLTFTPRTGQPIASALQVQTLGPTGRTGSTVFADAFDGAAGSPADPRRWTPVVGSGPFGSGEVQAYTGSRANSALDGRGALLLTARREEWSDDYGTRSHTSAKLTTQDKASFTYGRVTARVSFPSGAGLWPAVWALGTSRSRVDWPLCGELDVVEFLGSQPGTAFGTLHGLGDAADPVGWKDQHVSGVGGRATPGGDLSGGWHTVGMDVQPEAVTFSFDGVPYRTVTPADLRAGQQWPVGEPYYLILDLAVGGDWGGPPTASTVFPATFAVDDLRVINW